MSGSRRSGWLDAGAAVFAGALGLAIYVRSLAPGLLWGDDAEFQLAAWVGGFAHPTGYPLYLLLGWLWTHLLPVGDPAFRMNLFSAMWGGVAAGLVALLAMRLTRFVAGPNAFGFLGPSKVGSRLLGFGAALVFVFTPTFWSQAVVAEVYTLHATFVAAILFALLVWGERRLVGDVRSARRYSYLIALLFGLSLAHHRSTILLIPAALLFVAIVLRGSGWRRPRPRQVLGLSMALLAPLLLYLVIPLPRRTFLTPACRSVPENRWRSTNRRSPGSSRTSAAAFLARPSALRPGRWAPVDSWRGSSTNSRSTACCSAPPAWLTCCTQEPGAGAVGRGPRLRSPAGSSSSRRSSICSTQSATFTSFTSRPISSGSCGSRLRALPLSRSTGWLLSGQSAQARQQAAVVAAALSALVLAAFAYRASGCLLAENPAGRQRFGASGVAGPAGLGFAGKCRSDEQRPG